LKLVDDVSTGLRANVTIDDVVGYLFTVEIPGNDLDGVAIRNEYYSLV